MLDGECPLLLLTWAQMVTEGVPMHGQFVVGLFLLEDGRTGLHVAFVEENTADANGLSVFFTIGDVPCLQGIAQMNQGVDDRALSTLGSYPHPSIP